MKRKIIPALLGILVLCGIVVIVVHNARVNGDAYSFSPTSGICLEKGEKNNLSESGRLAEANNGITVLMIPMEDESNGFYLTAVSDNSRITGDVYLNSGSIVFRDSEQADITSHYSFTVAEESPHTVIKVEPNDNMGADEICSLQMLVSGMFYFKDIISLTDENTKTKLFGEYQCDVENIEVVAEPDNMLFLRFNMTFDSELIETSSLFNPGVAVTNGSDKRKVYFKNNEGNVFDFECEVKSDKPEGKLSLELPNMYIEVDANFQK